MEELSTLINRLEDIGASSGELYDTDVKEHMNEALVEIFIKENNKYRVPDSFGMFSKASDRSVLQAFTQFQFDLIKNNLNYKTKLDLLSPNGITSKNGQITECFFGEVSESSLSDKPKLTAYSWLQYEWVYYLFILAPGIIFLSITYIFFSSILHGLWYMPLFVLLIVASFIIGDTLWKFCVNYSLRKNEST